MNVPAEILDQSSAGLTVADGWPANLRLDHRLELKRSGLTPETVIKAGIHTEENHAALAEVLGWKKVPKKMGAAMVFPFQGANGENGYSRLKFSMPRRIKGKPVKYESPRGQPNRVYFPPGIFAALESVETDLLLTEGEKKSLAANQFGFPCLGLVGVFGWKDGRADRLLPDLERINWHGRNVYIGFDSDITDKAEVQEAEARLAAHLMARGADVRCVRLPAGPVGDDGKPTKVGLDDFLAAHGRDGLYKLLGEAIEPPSVSAVEGLAAAATMDPAPEVAGIVEADVQDGLSRLRFWRGGWWRWSNGAYREIEPEEIRAKLLLSLNCRYHHIGTFHVANCLDQLRAQTLLAGTTEAPMWLGDASVAWPPDEILAARNGLAHLPSIASGSGEIIAPTPRFFTTTALVYDLKLDAPEPANWLEFLGALWPDGQESIDTLQEWFGYVLTQDTRLQKILLLIGPRRSGKGTIGRILTAMIGRENVAGPTLGSLATQFGLAPLLGKSLAIIADARLSGRADQAAIVEQLLSISGEDTKTIDRKHAAAVTCRLPTRLTLLSNELPRFNDASGAAAGRMILLRLEESWYGKEDHDLEQRLLTELPGILLWAVAGWARLRRRGRFAEPEASTDLREALDELTSPVFAFVQARCVVGPEHEVETTELYGAYRGWCEMVGRERVEDEEGFGRALRAAITVERKQRKEGGHRWRVYKGVGLLPAPCG